MTGLPKALAAAITILATPCMAVESIYLDSVPVTNPGQFLAPENFYLQVPPPTTAFTAGGSLVPATLYDINITRSQGAVAPASGSVLYAGVAPRAEADPEEESDARAGKIRVHLKAGLDHASDIPLAVLREHLAESEDIELVTEAQSHDVLVEVETMKLPASATVFIVINAYKQVGDETLIFYNTFGYMGDLKLLSGSASYATNLETALIEEAATSRD